MAGTATVWVAALWARDLGKAVAGAAAALILGVSVPLLQWSHFGTTESALILVVVLLGWISSRALDGRMSVVRFALFGGMVMGLGLGLKTTVLAFALIPLSTLVLWRPGWRAGLRAVAIGGGLAATLWLATTPAIVLNWAEWRATMQFEGGVVRGTMDVFWTWQFVDRVPVLFELRQLWAATEGIGLILSATGLSAIASESGTLEAGDTRSALPSSIV